VMDVLTVFKKCSATNLPNSSGDCSQWGFNSQGGIFGLLTLGGWGWGCNTMQRSTYAEIVRLGQLVHGVLLSLRGHNLLVAADGPGLGKVAIEEGLHCQLARLMHPIPARRIVSATGSSHRSIRFDPPAPTIQAAEGPCINSSRAPSSPKCLRGDSNPGLGENGTHGCLLSFITRMSILP
jgi:hypothetical protein